MKRAEVRRFKNHHHPGFASKIVLSTSFYKYTYQSPHQLLLLPQSFSKNGEKLLRNKDISPLLWSSLSPPNSNF